MYARASCACVRVCTCIVCVYVHVHSKRQNEMTWCETDQCRNANDHKMFHKVPQEISFMIFYAVSGKVIKKV